MKTTTDFSFYFASLTLFAALCLTIGCAPTVDTPPKADVGTVSLTIDFPDDSQSADIDLQVGCAADSTVFEILQRAQKAGDLEFKHSSNVVQESTSIFIKAINGVGEANDKYWTYYVNDELAKEGCGTYLVKPEDKLRWVYGNPPTELQ